MIQVVSITSQGQLTIPASFRKILGITSQTKAVIERVGNSLVVKPKANFWSLSGSLKSSVKLSDEELKKARSEFSKKWPKKIR